MKIVFLTALLASVASGTLETNWPWQVGKLYRYEVQSHTLAQLPEGASTGYAFRSMFVIRAKAPGQLLARLEQSEHAPVHQELADHDWNTLKNFKSSPVKEFPVTFEIRHEDGRFVALKVPSTLSLSHENLVKGLISTLQVDLSTYRTAHSSQNNYDHESRQGQFTKMETDVTGECATLYAISPADLEWRRELKNMPLTEDPIMITKSRDYGHCHHRVAYHFGVPETATWTGTANKPGKEQFIDRTHNSRILAGKNGPIYKAETTNKIFVDTYVHSEQKAKVDSYTKITLVNFEDDRDEQWELPKSIRAVQSLLYTMSSKQIPTRDVSDESNEQDDVKVKTQKEQNEFFKQIVIHKRTNFVDTEDHSSSEYTSTYVNDDALGTDEPSYAAFYMNPQSHKVYKQNPSNAQKLVQELTQLLQKVSNMPKNDFLTKFNILVRVIASMNFEQLTQTSCAIEEAKSSNDVTKADMWMIYRDAVAQAGTLPAFKQIASWIRNKKIQYEEAAQIVSTLVNTMRYPTKQVMVDLFDLAMSPEVTKQQFLNSTALIAASKLINMAQVNNITASSYYPTYMYGRFAHKHDNFVSEVILPRLRQALDQAIKQEDTRNAQVYIKAIGKLGHQSILQVFAPYLEDKIPVSTYLRALMVDNLVLLAGERDPVTRVALYSILRNPAQPSEVRLAAIQNIFVALPTIEMMQAMAQMTHDDSSIQVRAAIKASIQAAAKLESPRHLELARIAQAVEPTLTKKEFGQQYFDQEYFENEYDLGIIGHLSMIGSAESVVLPKYLRYSRWSRSNGWDSISASVSSVQRLVEMFKKQMYEMRQEKYTAEKEPNHKYTARKVSEMLKIKREPQTPLEAALYFGLWNQQRYFTLSEYNFNQLPATMKQLLVELTESGMHYTKVYNEAQISVMFPMSSGMPFIYKYNEPTVFHIQAKVNKFNRAAQTAEFRSEIQFTFGRNIDESVGFLDSLTNNIASVGVVKKVQLHIPVRVDYTLNNGEHKLNLQQLHPENEALLAHYSVWPYTAIQKKDTLVPVSLDPATKLITRTNNSRFSIFPFDIFNNKYYEIEGYSYSQDYRMLYGNLEFPKKEIIKILKMKDVALTHFNFRTKRIAIPDPLEKNSGVTFTAMYDSFYNMNEETEAPLKANKMEDGSPNSAVRRAEMIKRVAGGIRNAKAQVIDLSVDWNENVHVLTAAMADSPVDRKIQYAVFVNATYGSSQSFFNGVAKVTKPDPMSMNAQQALEKEHKIYFESDFNLSVDSMITRMQTKVFNFQIKGFGERTNRYADALKALPWAKKCTEQMSRNNYYQNECHKLVIMAQAPDRFDISVSSNEENLLKLSQMALQSAKRFIMENYYASVGGPYYNIKLINEGKHEFTIRMNYLENVMSVEDDDRLELSIEPVLGYYLSTYQPIKPYERFLNYYSDHQFQPFCTVDGNQIRTFSDRRYNYVLSPEWHVVMQDAPKQYSWQDELVVLAKRPTEQQQEVYISYQSETGQNLEIEIKPDSSKYNVDVTTNSKKVSEGDLTMYWDKAEKEPLMKYYILSDGALMLSIRENRLRIMYDGQRLVVLTRDGRNSIRGLCGLMNGDPRDDYWTPEGLVDSDEQFGASYALEGMRTSQSSPQMRPYQRRYKYTNILKSDSQWQEWQRGNSTDSSDDWNRQKVYMTRLHIKQPRGTCMLGKQVQYYENSNEICITTKALSACPTHCRGKDYKIQQEQVVCGPRTPMFQEYVNQINRGQNPKVSGPTEMSKYKVPASCKA